MFKVYYYSLKDDERKCKETCDDVLLARIIAESLSRTHYYAEIVDSRTNRTIIIYKTGSEW